MGLGLLATALLSFELPGVPPALARMAVLIIAAGLATAALWPSVRRRWWLAAVAIASWCGLAISPDGPWMLPAFLLFVSLIQWLAGSRSVRVVHRLAGLVAAGLCMTLLQAVPSLSYALGEWSAAATGWLTAPLGGSPLGASASGLLWTLACLSAVVATSNGSSRRRLTWVVMGLGGLLIVHAVGQSLGPTFGLRALGKAAFVGVATFLAIASTGRETRQRSRFRVGAGIVLCVALLATGGTWWDTGKPGSVDVVILDLEILGSWEIPADRAPGTAFTGAMFGLLPDYLARYGIRATRVVTIEEAIAASADLIVTINPGRRVAPEKRDALLQYVREGGGLAVLGDHTDVGDVMKHVNSLVGPAGLELVFDSAVSAIHAWARTMSVERPLGLIHAPDAVHVSIGASVATASPLFTQPLLLGTGGFSDPGDYDNEASAYLGNLEYDRGERYGGVALALMRPLGRGKVALFGDTSGFQNMSLSMSADYVASAFSMLADASPAWLFRAHVLLGLLCLILSPCALRYAPLRMISGLAAGMTLVALLATWSMAGSAPTPVSGDTPLAVVDLAHGQAVSTRPLTDESLDALLVSLSRAGYLPIVHEERSLPDLSPSDLLLSVAATRPLSRREIDRLQTDLTAGARLIVSTQWPASVTAWPWLAKLGVTVDNVPLGTIRPAIDGLAESPELGAAWALRADETWQILAASSYPDQEIPVAVGKRVGAGEIVVVSDAKLFTTASLETRGTYVGPNLAFVRWLVEGVSE